MLAQSILQLYREVTARDWADADVERLVAGHRLCSRLFTGRYRASGKTFVAHCIGTASAAARGELEPDLVLAGLTHAAYTLGDWGDGRGAGRTEARAKQLEDAVSAGPERVVARYAEMTWSPAEISGWGLNTESLRGPDRPVVLVRIANECDEHLDGGLRLSGSDRDDRLANGGLQAMQRIAASLGRPQLGDLLAQIADDAAVVELPASAIGPHNRSYLLRPSAVPRAGLRRAASRVYRRVRRHI